MITDYHAKYFAHELSRRHSAADSEKLAGALFDAQVDLNPHQVSAALFAFKSPLSKGAILADEVGLGKTIEAGLVLSQKWAEGKRRILIITPASLRKQWVQEMRDKFFLPAMIMEAKNYNRMIKDGVRRPFEQPEIILCSFQFAARHDEELMVMPWDLVVIDEAHRLRNVFKPGNKIGRALRSALSNVPKLLLTATPLQNSLMELYGLVSFIDEYAFGDAKSFRSQYARLTGDSSFNELKSRLEPICHRTLRRQVLEYIRYTNRIAITEEFVPTQEEQTLYDLVSDYLRRPSLQALPSSQRTLMTLNEDGTTSLGKIGQWFEEAYKEFSEKPRFRGVIPHPVEDVHNGYFSQDNKGKAKDTSGKTKDDEDTYNLIMKDKERLLDSDVPLRFIFSHSALREGWDNPNVFQICTLNETRSVDRKRQEIGRGLRLPVNFKGERVHDEHINRLTVIANESYETFARSLQSEFEEDFGIKFGQVEKIAFAKIVRVVEEEETPIGQETSERIWKEIKDAGYINAAGEILDTFDPDAPAFDLKVSEEFADIKPAIIDEISRYVFKNRVADARKRKAVSFQKAVQLREDFGELWDRIKHRTRYRVQFDTEELVKRAVERIKDLPPIKALEMHTTKVEVAVTKAGVDTDVKLDEKSTRLEAVTVLPDILAYLQKETELTRHTLVQILKRSGRLGDFKVNPQQFMALAGREISRALHDLMLKGIQYEKIAGQNWEMSRIEQDAEDGISRYLSNLYEVQNRDKCLFDHIEFDSEVEKRFARDLDNNEHVKLFVKLPAWFKIDTPIGPYNPDWAFVTERDERLYFVRETKSSGDKEELRTKENQKIECGKRHFEAIDVDYGVVTKLSEVAF